MSFNVERGLITKILETRDLMSVRDKQIKISYFSGDNRTAYQYIYDQMSETGEVPTIRAFQKRFPRYMLDRVERDGVEVIGNDESVDFWCNELRTKIKHNTLADVIDEVAKSLGDRETEYAYDMLKQKIAYIDAEIEYAEEEDLTDVAGRKEAYLKKKRTQGMIGIETGFKHLDYIMKGLAPATLTTLIANTGVGKTWFEIIIGANCVLNDYKVLHFVTEMSSDIMRDRYESVLFAKCYGEFDYNAFKSGTLSLKQEKQYFEFLENDLANFEPFVLATATGVMGVSAMIDKYKPDLVLIDSAYLMEDDQGARDDWLRVAHITRDLKKLAKRANVPIFINTQADKNTSKKTGPELGSIMYTQAIGQDSDNVLALYRDTTMISDREMGVKVLKQREGTLGKMMLNWNFDVMDFSEIYMEKEDYDGGDIHDNTLSLEEDEED